MTVQEGMAHRAAVKHVCTENAIRAVDRLAEVVGGAAYSRAHPVRAVLARDVPVGRSCRSTRPCQELALAPEIDALETGVDGRARAPIPS